MKKKITSVVIISAVVLMLAYCLLWIFGSEAGIKVFLTHNRGEISLFVNGEQIDINRTEIKWNTDTAEVKNGKFKFQKGSYGCNIFEYKIPGYEYVTVKFGIFNTNWWHVNEYDIDISVTDDNGIIHVEAEQKISAEGSCDTAINSIDLKKGEEKDLWVYLGP